MNQVETWFSIVHRKAIRRGVFRSVPHLKDAIQRFIDSWNARRHPFVWVKTADEILANANQKAISAAVALAQRGAAALAVEARSPASSQYHQPADDRGQDAEPG